MTTSTTWSPVNLMGQEMAAGDERALHRDLYAGEVLTAYRAAIVTEGRHANKNLSGGKAYKFPVFGESHGAKRHRIGERVVPSQLKRTHITVELDERIYSTIFVDELDEILADVDARGIYTSAQAYEMAKMKDQTILRMMIKAARSTGIMAGEMPGGGRLSDADYRTDASKLAAGIFNASNILRGKNVNPATVAAFLTPTLESLLVQNKETINRDWGGDGSYSAGTIARVGGVGFVVTNHLPFEDLSDDTAIAAAGYDADTLFEKYRGDYSDVACIVSDNRTVATVTAVDLDVRWVEARDSFGESVTTSYAYGAGVYRPEGAVELTVGSL